MEMMVRERNKVKDRERNKCGATGSILVTGFRRLKDVKSFSQAPLRVFQTVEFQRDQSVRQAISMASIGGSKKAKTLIYSTCRQSHAGTSCKVAGVCYGYRSSDHFVRDYPNKGG
ncbi:hypothetical protein GOBAR_DD25959 [Gossypium barbadense]|nr:hypothetical protein GOBAR_DD25959 [Gossypium barbadense]